MVGLTKAVIDRELKAPTKDVRLWDDNPKGLGIRIKPSGSGSFFIQYRSPVTFKKTRFTLGQYGKLSIEAARKRAKSEFEAVAAGKDPKILKAQSKHDADVAATMSDFCDDYMRDAESGLVTYRGRSKKPSTIAVDRGRIERHIKPLLGTKLVRDITTHDIIRAMHDIRLGKTAADIKTKKRGRAIVTGGPGTAAKSVTLMGSIFSYAIKQGVRSDNPAQGVEKPADGRRDRIISPEEFKRLGDAFAKHEEGASNKIALRAYRVIALTGWRLDDVLSLEKSEIDLHNKCIRFGDTKTGQQARAASNEVLKLVSDNPFDEKSKFVFPASRGNGHLTDTKLFRKIRDEVNLADVSPHIFRHSFASVALEMEYSELTIAELLGQKSHSVTSRYTHHVDKLLIAAANRISGTISARMRGIDLELDNIIQFSG